jgi:diaminopimelate epimerase
VNVAKWHGAGNTYLVVDERDCPVTLGAAQVGLLCHPRLGLGGDGVLLCGPSAVADVRMRILNPDGSRSEACGNGTRIVAAWTGREEVAIETAAGVLRAQVGPDRVVAAEMPRARLESPQYRPNDEPFPYMHRFVSIGNPHLTMRTHDPASFPLEREGPQLEHHPWVPERANVEVWTVRDGAVEMRVWERGVGETAACGTGACAVAVAAVLDDAAQSPVRIRLPGGDLQVEVTDELDLRMTGPVAEIGVMSLAPSFLDALVWA